MVTHLDQVIASFFLPVAEPLGLPENSPIETFLPINKLAIDRLTESELEFAFAPLHDRSAPAIVRSADLGEGKGRSAPQVWANKFTLSSSLVVHQVGTDPWARSGLDAVSVVAATASGERYDPNSVRLSTLRQDSQISAHLEEAADLGIGQVTVLEAAVPLRLIGEIGSSDDFNGDLLEIVHLPSGPDDLGPSPDLWPFFNAQDEVIDPVRLTQRLYWALGVAINDIRNVQKAYHSVTRHPITLLTRERLPHLLPVTNRKLRDIGATDNVHQWIVHVNDNAWSLLRPQTLVDRQLEGLAQARRRVDGGVFSAHLDLHREANAALSRQGDTRVAAMLSAIAAESLLDELLMHMMWEEGQLPEEAAEGWIGGLATRVKREYSQRLGGQWDMGGVGPVGDWARDVAGLRHRVVHAAYVPDADEAKRSIAVLDAFVSYLCDRLAAGDRLVRYPRTALTLAGEDGLARRGALTRRIQELSQSSSEPDWTQTFARWQDAHNRIRRDLVEGPRTPRAQTAYLYVVRRTDGTTYWCLHDRASHLAAPVDVDLDELTEEQRHGLASTLESIEAESPGVAVSIEVEKPETIRSSEGKAWQEEYHLVPLADVMVDGSGLSVPATYLLDASRSN